MQSVILSAHPVSVYFFGSSQNCVTDSRGARLVVTPSGVASRRAGGEESAQALTTNGEAESNRILRVDIAVFTMLIVC